MKVLYKIVLILSVLLLFIGLIMLTAYVYYIKQLNNPVQVTEDNHTFEIAKGSTVSDISNQLYELGYLSNPIILKAYLWQHPDKTIQAGFYNIGDTKFVTIPSLVDKLQTGSFNIKLTFLEGWRTEEYADYLSKKISPEFANKFLKSKYVKEGYMFPDTYTIDREYDPSLLASFMRNTFDKKVPAELFEKAKERGLTKDEVVILASILEREMNIEKDKPVVAGIYVKRLKNGWPLQADATIQYAKGKPGNWWPKDLGNDIKSFDSPYNTYLYKGLPPGPISNPGLHSISAVVNYVETPYWFYLTDTNGITHFSTTLEEHNRNVMKYLR